MAEFDVDSTLASLEQLQITAGLDAKQYGQLLICYMIKDDLINSKFAWKTVAEPLKLEEPILKEIWAIGRGLIQYLHADAFKTIKNTTWPDWIKPCIDALHNVLVERCIVFVAKAYSSIDINKFAQIFDISKDDAKTLASKYKWTESGGFIMPMAQQSTVAEDLALNGRIPKLTGYISFLEC